MLFPNDDKYEGQYEYGMRNGKGKFYIAMQDKVIEDFWINDKRLDEGQITDIDYEIFKLQSQSPDYSPEREGRRK